MLRKLIFLACITFWTLNGFAQDCPEECQLIVPKKVTEDCDGPDCHYFDIDSNCEFRKFRLRLFNQRGEVIFESNNPEDRFSSKGVEKAVYLWQLEYTDCNRNKRTERGYVTVLK